jgi:hypothetical protein
MPFKVELRNNAKGTSIGNFFSDTKTALQELADSLKWELNQMGCSTTERMARLYEKSLRGIFDSCPCATEGYRNVREQKKIILKEI